MVVLHVRHILYYFSVFLSRSVVISGVFVYFCWYKNKQLNLKNILNVNYSKTETEIY